MTGEKIEVVYDQEGAPQARVTRTLFRGEQLPGVRSATVRSAIDERAVLVLEIIDFEIRPAKQEENHGG